MIKIYQVQITKYAQRQMRDIAKYVKEKLKNPDAAKNLIGILEKAILSLSSMPHRIPLTDEEPWFGEGIRKMPVKNFLIYFWINEDKNEVHVTAVIYNKREQKRQLFRMKME